LIRDELRKSDPEAAAELESYPWYHDPDGPYAGDNFAQCSWEWSGEDQIIKCWDSFVDLKYIALFKKYMLGKLTQHSTSGVANEDNMDYSFNLRASYALAVLRAKQIIPRDSKLMNEDDRPLRYCTGDEDSGGPEVGASA
jgi:hypothetical protein